MKISKTFDSYQVWYYSAPQYKYRVMIQLYYNRNFIGRILFMKEGEVLPTNYQINNRPYLHYDMADYAPMMDMLRNEKPLYIQFVPENGIGFIGTRELEPVGEFESAFS